MIKHIWIDCKLFYQIQFLIHQVHQKHQLQKLTQTSQLSVSPKVCIINTSTIIIMLRIHTSSSLQFLGSNSRVFSADNISAVAVCYKRHYSNALNHAVIITTYSWKGWSRNKVGGWFQQCQNQIYFYIFRITLNNHAS